MSARTFDEVKASVEAAFSTSDVPALQKYAAELDAIGTPEALAMSAHARGYAEMLYNNYAQALEHYNNARELCEQNGNRAGVASVTSNIGIVFIRMGNHAQALEYWNRARGVYEELDNQLGIANTTCNIGNIYARESDYPKALEHYRRALDMHTELDAKKFMAIDTTCIGEVYKNTGNYPLALEHYYRALALNEELGNRHGVANATGNIGTVYVYTGNSEMALEYLHRSLHLYEELGVRSGWADIIICIGNVYSNNGDYEKALEQYYRAKTVHAEIGEQASLALVTGNIINALVEMGSIDEAEELFAITEELRTDEPNTAIVRDEIRASIQQHHGQLDDAMQTLRSALLLAQEHSLVRVQANIHSQLRDLCQKKNDFAGYIEHNNEYTRINIEINGKDTAIKLALQEAENRIAKERELLAKESERVANERERERSVLYSTLPKHIADRVIRGEVVNDHIDNAAVMFLDIVGFTTLSSTLTSEHVIKLLDAVFKVCDEACAQHNVTRIKTIGDSYLAVAFGAVANEVVGAEWRVESVSAAVAKTALQIIERIRAIDFESLLVASSRLSSLHVRIGLHNGPVTAGVLGTERLQYDVWGDTVNVASRMESTSEPNRIHVSEQFAQSLCDLFGMKPHVPGDTVTMEHGARNVEHGTWTLILRGLTEVKGIGPLTTYWLE